MARQWMPMYWGDYSRKTQHLSTLEHGAYLLLIAHYWNTGKPIPNDDDVLRRITRTTTKQWNSISKNIRELFTDLGTELRHERVDEELKSSQGISTSQSSNAKQRWKNQKNQQGDLYGGTTAGMPTTTTPTNYNLPLTSTTPSAGGGVSKNGFGEGKFDVMLRLSDEGREAARKAADGWDIYYLAGIYNESVKRMGEPRNVNAAFPAWCANYTKGKKP